jgi:hypothetical protein
MARGRHDETVHGIGQDSARRACGVECHGQRNVDQTRAQPGHRLVDPPIHGQRQAQPAGSVQGRNLEHGRDRNMNRFLGDGALEPAAGAWPDAAGIAIHDPDPDVGVEEKHGATVQSRLTSYSPSTGSNGRS